MIRQLILVFTLCAVCATASFNVNDGASDLIDRLIPLIQNLQVKKTTKYIPLVELRKQKGVYESYIKLNLHGGPNVAFVREDLNIFDNNMFVTAWVTTCLLEAYRYGHAPAPTSEQVTLSLEAINDHTDKNKPYANSVKVFWPQVYNATVKTYQSVPQNLINAFKLLTYLPLKDIEEILKWLGFEYVEEVIAKLMGMK